jgi:glycerate dehydrogenase
MGPALADSRSYCHGPHAVQGKPGHTSPLLSARNCLITPHIARATREARRRLPDATVSDVESSLAGRPTNVVNRPA